MFKIAGEVDPTLFNTLTELLRKRPIPINRSRKTSGVGRSQVFGICRQRTGHYAGSRMNYERPDLFEEIIRIGNQILPTGFTYQAIQLNMNYETEAHTDKGNRGESAIIGFGDYEKGELVVNATEVDIKNKVILFDGSKWVHRTKPFTGTRFSLVYHTVDRDFKEIPVFSFVADDKGKLILREDLEGSTRIYNRDGRVTFSSNGVYPVVIPKKSILRNCVDADSPLQPNKL